MKNNVKFIIYVVIIICFATVIWIKYDYDKGNNSNQKDTSIDEFAEFIENNNIRKINFICPAKNETITYLDDEYLLTDLGEMYQVKFDSLFDNGYNCRKIENPVKFKGFYANNGIVYDNEFNFYDVKNNLNIYDGDMVDYYYNDLNNLNKINKKYPYIYFYDIEAKELSLDESNSSSKLLIDNRGNINIYTNYGYPTSLNLLESEDTEIIFERLDYMGIVLSIFRTNNNEILNPDKINYLKISEEVPKELYGIRIITTKGMYNEVADKECKEEVCDTKLVMDKSFSKYFDNIIYSNGKYLFFKDTPTTIYNIEKYISNL